ncbi:MAG: YtxH domain-containing protein [Flavobacteriales bacterium]|nr:YtxH domain-containing protein [Flavobacteriales bacterium]
MTNRNILIALLGAGLAGATVGLLLAPDSGKTTRKKLMKKALSAKDSIAYCLLQVEEQMDHMRGKLGKDADTATNPELHASDK